MVFGVVFFNGVDNIFYIFQDFVVIDIGVMIYLWRIIVVVIYLIVYEVVFSFFDFYFFSVFVVKNIVFFVF